MLTIQSCNPTGFFSYGLHETVPLDNQGVVLLTGINRDRLATTANASGKSSLLNTVTHILYGQNPTEKGEDKIVNEVWDHGCWGMVKFTNNGKQYRIILTRGWKGPYPDKDVENEPCQVHDEGARYEGTNLYLDVLDRDRWTDLRKTRVPETRALLLTILGISYDRFLATSYLAQQKGLAFIGGKNKDRMELITELTDMKIWDECVAAAKARIKAADTTMAKLQLEQMAFQTRATTLAGGSLADPALARRELERLLTENADASNKIVYKSMELDESITKRIGIAAEIAAATTVQEAIAMEMAELSKRISAEDINLVKLAAIRAQPVRNPNIENGNALRMQELMNIKWGLERQLEDMLEAGGKCYACGTDVSDDHIAAERAAAAVKMTANEINIAALSDEMAAIDKAAQDAHITNTDLKIKVASETREELAIKLQASDDSLMMSKIAITKLNTTDLEWAAIGTKIQMDILTLKMQSDANVQTMASLQVALDRDADVKRQIAEATEEADKLQHALDMARQESFYLETIVRGMGDKGVKAHKFGAMIQTLNDLVAENIRVLTDGQVQVWFSPWREKANAKSSDDIVPEIQIFVKEGPKEQVELALYSGMERQQIVIAIIRAFNKLAILQGAGTNILFMDEMFGMFDEASAATAIKLMNQLKNSDWGTIVVVTHNPDIKQVLEYDQLWTAEKQNHITTLRRETK